MSYRLTQAFEVVEAALQLAPEERSSFLDANCTEESLRKYVECLLLSYEEAGQFLEEPALAIYAGLLLEDDEETAAALPSHSSQACNFAPGSVVADRYRIVSLLGRGGMGEVYVADDLKLGQKVALKFLPAQYGKKQSWREQFYAEVRMARQVSHPNVCRVYDVGESEGRLFISMEFVDGEDLASLLRRIGRVPEDKAAEIAQQLCVGLAAAHRSGVLHRDLKPANVMIDGKGRARITDFGVAISASEADDETSPAGTPGYLAPEILDGGAPSVQSDLYALGLVLYELFTGKKALNAINLADLRREQTETTPIPPSSVIKNVDPAIERAILGCLDHDPSQRPRSALSVAAALPGGDHWRLCWRLEKLLRLRLWRLPDRKARSVPRLPGLTSPLHSF